MTTAVDDIDPIQKPSDGGKDDGDDGPKDFKFYCKAENAY